MPRQKSTSTLLLPGILNIINLCPQSILPFLALFGIMMKKRMLFKQTYRPELKVSYIR